MARRQYPSGEDMDYGLFLPGLLLVAAGAIGVAAMIWAKQTDALSGGVLLGVRMGCIVLMIWAFCVLAVVVFSRSTIWISRIAWTNIALGTLIIALLVFICLAPL